MRQALFAVAVLAATAFANPAVADESASDLTEMQVVMQRHIDSVLIDGAMHKIDLETGEVKQYYPTEAHAMVMSVGEDYILCTDLASKDGDRVPVDFYVTRTAEGYKIYQTEIDNRGPLRELMGKGLAERIR